MKKNIGLRGICVVLILALFLTGINLPLTGFAKETEVNTASSYLYPFEEAVNSFGKLIEGTEITAAVYLEDELYVRKLPQKESEPVAQVVSGDVVSLTAVGQDETYAIWYQVKVTKEGESVVGYLPRENLACTQEEFTQWEETYVRSMARGNSKHREYDFSDVESFPLSYQNILKEVKEKHPQWIFVKMNTGISWNDLIQSQKGGRSLVYSPTSPENWKEGSYGTTKWSYASEGIIKYFIDPRNWISEKNIFQFQLLGYSADYHTEEAVQNLLSNSFMATGQLENNKSYANTFVALGKSTGISPFLMATRIRQEQGSDGSSALISGTYPGYEGYYNYYNIGASGKTDKEVVISGLEKAKKEGWNSRVKALEAGAEFLGGSYINAGQDTLYLQKFDVDSRSNGVFWHQYMQNIQAPSTEGVKVYQAYQKSQLLDEAFIFRIPVYDNMPQSAAVLPGKEDRITLSSKEITDLQIGSEVTLHPSINEKEAPEMEWSFESSDESVATVDDNGVVKAVGTGTVTITCRKKEDMSNTLEGSCKITVIKAQLDLETLELPKLDAVVYDPKQTLKDISLPEGYLWVNPEMVPNASQEKYGVTYNPDPKRFDQVTFDIVLVVKKAIPVYELPNNLEGGAGRELQSVILPQGFWWKNPEEILSQRIGVVEYAACYNPDAFNYETIEELWIPVNIVCEVHNFGEWEIKEASCEEKGWKKRSCKTCDTIEELILEPTGHQYQIVEEIEATQKEEGKRVYSCEVCSHSYEESIPKLPTLHEHSYEKTEIKKASCELPGLIEYVCSCQDSYQEVIEASGHEMKEGTCILCGYLEENGILDQEENPSGSDSTKEEKEPEQVPEKEESESANKKPEKEESESTNKKPEKEESESSNKKPEKEESDSSEKKPEEGKKPDNKEDSALEQVPEKEGNESHNKKPGKEESNNSEKKPEEGKKPDSKEEFTLDQKLQGEEKTQNQQNSQDTAVVQKEPVEVLETQQGEERRDEAAQVQKEEISPQDVKKNQPTEYVEVDLMSLLVDNTTKKEEQQEKEDIILQLAKNTEISQNILKMAKNYGVDMVVGLTNGLSWSIPSASMDKELPGKLNLGARITENVIPDELIEAIGETTDYVELSLAHDGEFGFEATLTIPVKEQREGTFANLYYYNPNLEQLEFVIATKVTKEGEIKLTFSHASDYLIVFAETSLEKEKIVTKEQVQNETKLKEDFHSVETATETKSYRTLIIVIVIIMLLSLGLIFFGIFLMRGKKEEEFFDEDIDDYREKKEEEGKNISFRKEARTEEEFFDEDVDDYQEKNREEKA